ncbi:MAG: TIGR03118 family protein [Pseudolabrys sp.]
MRLIGLVFRFGVAVVVGLGAQSANAQFTETNLFSDIPGQANAVDPNLVNPWGIVSSSTSPVWVANEGSGVATLYKGAGNGAVAVPLVVSIPSASVSQGTPTAVVFNSTNSFLLTNGNGQKALFLFATKDGQIVGWNGGTTAVAQVLASPSNVYTGLAEGPSASGDTLYAANFKSGSINAFSAGFSAIITSSPFIDPNLPAGYAPFNVENINGNLYVSFALQNATKDGPLAGAGNGLIDVFNLNGAFLQRLVSNGVLNTPWGMAVAPANFGSFGGDLLVGNNGDGTIDAFDPITGMLIGMLKDAQGNPIMVSGLMALAFGNGTSFDSNALLFTGGDGIFGEIQNAETPLPAALPLFASGVALLGFIGWRRKGKVIATA